MARKQKTPPAKKEAGVQQNATGGQGQIIQAGRDVTISQPAKSDDGGSFGKKLALWLGIIIAVLTIAGFFLDLPGKLRQNWQPASTRYYGQVVDATGAGVAGAQIFVLDKAGGDTIGVGRTEANGDFNFIVKAKSESSAYIRVLKDGHAGFREYKVLAAGDKIRFEPIDNE